MPSLDAAIALLQDLVDRSAAGDPGAILAVHCLIAGSTILLALLALSPTVALALALALA